MDGRGTDQVGIIPTQSSLAGVGDGAEIGNIEVVKQDWVVGRFLLKIIPLRGSILQAGAYQILSLAENPRWSRLWQYC